MNKKTNRIWKMIIALFVLTLFFFTVVPLIHIIMFNRIYPNKDKIDAEAFDQTKRIAASHAFSFKDKVLLLFWIDHGANACGMLQHAVANERFDIAEYLLIHGKVAQDYTSEQQIESFSRVKSIKMLKMLKEYLGLQHTDEYGNTLLHIYVLRSLKPEDEEILLYLTKGLINVNSINNFGVTPLHNAVRRNNYRATEILLQRFADVNATTQTGKSPLHAAALSDGNPDPAVVRLLLDHNADVNSVDVWGNSPLFYAHAKGNTKIEEELILRGANQELKNANGNTYRDAILTYANELNIVY